MFNWFKNKLNSLIPSDFEKGFMSYNFCSVKINSNLTVPENSVCFVCYRNKIYLELTAGSYTLDENTLHSVYIKQSKNKELKKIKLDLYFVNLKK